MLRGDTFQRDTWKKGARPPPHLVSALVVKYCQALFARECTAGVSSTAPFREFSARRGDLYTHGRGKDRARQSQEAQDNARKVGYNLLDAGTGVQRAYPCPVLSSCPLAVCAFSSAWGLYSSLVPGKAGSQRLNCMQTKATGA